MVCSKSCGGGIQTRSVTCIQEVRHGGSNILTVDDMQCPQPPPIKQQFCNIVDCPVKWYAGTWSKVIFFSKTWPTHNGKKNIWLDFSMQCSQECGGGFKTRKVRCQQLLALGEIANKPVGHCSKDRPSTEKKCNPQECPPGEYRQIKLLLKGLLNQAFLMTTFLDWDVATYYRRLTEFGPLMWQAEADLDLTCLLCLPQQWAKFC